MLPTDAGGSTARFPTQSSALISSRDAAPIGTENPPPPELKEPPGLAESPESSESPAELPTQLPAQLSSKLGDNVGETLVRLIVADVTEENRENIGDEAAVSVAAAPAVAGSDKFDGWAKKKNDGPVLFCYDVTGAFHDGRMNYQPPLCPSRSKLLPSQPLLWFVIFPACISVCTSI